MSTLPPTQPGVQPGFEVSVERIQLGSKDLGEVLSWRQAKRQAKSGRGPVAYNGSEGHTDGPVDLVLSECEQGPLRPMWLEEWPLRPTALSLWALTFTCTCCTA